MTNLEVEALRLIQSQLITGEARIYDHVANTFRWLMATLFAANGGAVLALLGNPQLAADKVALACFALGLVLSISMGILSTFWGQRASVRMAAIRARVEKSLIEGAIDAEIVAAIDAEAPNWKTWTPSYIGGASFVALIAGLLVTAIRH